MRGNVSAGAAIFAALLVKQAKDWVIWEAIGSPATVAQGKYLKEVIATNSPLPIAGHAALTPDDDGKVSAQILQKALDIEGEILQVAKVEIVEDLQGIDDGACVDLCVAATANGTLTFSARHKTLDVNLTVKVLMDEQCTTTVDITPEILQPPSPNNESWSSSEPQYNSGILLENLDGRWFVKTVYVDSPADKAGVKVYDEVLWIDENHNFYFGSDIPNRLQGKLTESRTISLLRSDGIHTVTLALTEPVYSNDEIALKLKIADATILGSTGRIIQGLLGFANQAIRSEDVASLSRAQAAIDHARELINNNSVNSDELKLQLLCKDSHSDSPTTEYNSIRNYRPLTNFLSK